MAEGLLLAAIFTSLGVLLGSVLGSVVFTLAIERGGWERRR